MLECASTVRYPDLLGNKRLYRPRAYSFINPWFILYLLVITIVEARRHLSNVIDIKGGPEGLGKKTSKFRLDTIRGGHVEIWIRIHLNLHSEVEA